MRAHVERRLRFALSRFGERIGRVTVGAILLSLRGSGITTGGSLVDETESP